MAGYPPIPIDPHNPPAMTRKWAVKKTNTAGVTTTELITDKEQEAHDFARSIAGTVEPVNVPADSNTASRLTQDAERNAQEATQ